MNWVGRVLAVTCLVAATASVSVAADDASHVGFAERLLIAHNVERDRQNVARLRWSGQLAAQAQAWASTLARSNRFEHAADSSGAGENLWMGTAGHYSPEDMIEGFVSERRHFRPGRFPDVSRTGNWLDIGHYTQVIWPATQEVGCAVSRGGDRDILVCRYYPAGNLVGEKLG